MTMLDDDRLASLFARAGAAFEVPATGRRRHPGAGGRTRGHGPPTGTASGEVPDGDGSARSRRGRPPARGVPTSMASRGACAA